MKKALFIDRDGIVNSKIPNNYVKSPQDFMFKEDFVPIFLWAKQHGFLTILITNQQGIGKGLMSENDLYNIHTHMNELLLQRTGSGFDDIYYSADLSGSGSFRRKPNPGMLLEAIVKWQIDPTLSWMIGDSISDVIAGKACGATTILIGDFSSEEVPDADYICFSLQEIIGILEQ